MDEYRRAKLFDNIRKEGDGILVIVHGFFQCGNYQDGYGPCVVVEYESGNVEEHDPGKIKFC